MALISTPSPGGIGLSVADNSTDVLVATNSAANTFTAFSLQGLTVGQTISERAGLHCQGAVDGQHTDGDFDQYARTRDGSASDLNRDVGIFGPNRSLVMWADFSDGTVNTITLADEEPVKTFNLGADSAPQRHRHVALFRQHHVCGHLAGP